MRLFPWSRRSAGPARRQAAFAPRLEGLDDRSLPSAVGFSTALPSNAYATAVDAAGNSVVSTGAGVYKFDPAGRLLASNTTVKAGGGIALDAAGDVYVNYQGVITELDPNLRQTLFAVTLPGATYSSYGYTGPGAYGTVAVAGGKIYAVGAAADGLPTTATAYQPAYPGAASGLHSVYLAVIDPASAAPYHLAYCTYLGGTTKTTYGYGATVWGASASGVAVDAAGAVYLTGSTNAADFPTTAGAFQTVNRGGAAGGGATGTLGWTSYVAKIDPSRSGAASLAYSTFLGGTGRDGFVTHAGAITSFAAGPAITVDAAGSAYVTGSTTSADFPTTAGAFQTTYTPVPTYNRNLQLVGGHAYVTKLTPDGSRLAFSTLLEGSSWDYGDGIALDGGGNVWVTGGTRSADFPVTAGAAQRAKATGTLPGSTVPNADAFVVELNPTGSGEKYGTFWGGKGDEFGMGIAVGSSGDVFVGGVFVDEGTGLYPTTPGAYQTTGSGFLLKFKP